MATADGYVLPKPGIPKTLGILSVIFSVILILAGACLLATTIAGPALLQFSETMIKQAQEKAEADVKAQNVALDEKEKAAKTDEEKASIKAERDALAATPKVQTPDMKAAMGLMDDPTVKMYTLTTYFSGLILHVILLIAGIGLIRLTSWGRTLAVYWAGLQIFQLVAMTGLSIGYVQPKAVAVQDKIIADAEAKAKAGGAPDPTLAGLKAGKAMQQFAVPMSIGWILIGSAFPTVLLIMLNGAGARAACRSAKPIEQGFGEI